MKRILVIAAHPDDEVFGMGGTIAKRVRQGDEVYVLIVSDGSTAQYRDSKELSSIIREKEEQIKCANEILGVKEVIHSNLPDMQLDSVKHIDVNEVIEKAIEIIKPEVVYTHFYGDVNMDHRCVYHSTMVAVRPTPTQCVKEVYCYSVPSSTEWEPQKSDTCFMPNVFVEIEDFFKFKEEAIRAYSAELRDFPHPRSVEYVRTMDTANGLKCGQKMVEEFVCLRCIEE